MSIFSFSPQFIDVSVLGTRWRSITMNWVNILDHKPVMTIKSINDTRVRFLYPNLKARCIAIFYDKTSDQVLKGPTYVFQKIDVEGVWEIGKPAFSPSCWLRRPACTWPTTWFSAECCSYRLESASTTRWAAVDSELRMSTFWVTGTWAYFRLPCPSRCPSSPPSCC